MNDEMNPGAARPYQPIRFASGPPHRRRPHGEGSISRWLKKLLVCNPFYLLSAALLLFGMYRVSVDPNFLPAEVAQLTFNFSSLQCYELLLVGTAIFLARRRIWYDSTLLVVLENLLVLVPFILISQAALVEQPTGRLLCGAAALLIVGRALAVRRWITTLDFSWRLIGLGLPVLLVNAAWPVIYRFLQETKMGKKMTTGPAYEMNELSWLWLLPVLCALVYLLPRPTFAPTENPKRSRWFPTGLFSLWLLGTGVHLYALGYIYDYDLRTEQLAPALWVLVLRLPVYFAAPSPVWRRAALALPLLVTFLAANVTESHVFCWLAALNVLAFAGTAWRERGNRLALHLALISLATFVGALPVDWLPSGTDPLDRAQVLVVAGLVYGMICSALSRNPKIAIVGGIAAAWLVGLLRGDHGDTLYWAAQAGFVSFLLHSLRWQDHEHQGAAAGRMLVAVGWLMHTVAWVRDDAMIWQPLIMAAVVLLGWAVRGLIFQRWSPLVAPGAALAVALCGPANLALSKLGSLPLGVTAISSSFLLFAIGTALALTKHRWHKSDADTNP